MFSRSVKEPEKDKKEIEELKRTVRIQDSKLTLYDGLLKKLQENQKAGAKLIKIDDVSIIGSYIDEDLFEKIFSGSIGYLKANGIVNNDVKIDSHTLAHYQIATHKFVREYLNFCMNLAPDRLIKNITEYTDLTNQPKD